MKSDPAAALPDVVWSTEVGWQAAGPLDWAAVGGDAPWVETGGALQGPAHRPLLPPTTLATLEEESSPPAGAGNAHDALELVLASPSWLVHARRLLYSPWSPLPAALASLSEAYGVGPEVHGFDPDMLRLLAWMLPRWFAERGSTLAARELLEALDALPSRSGDYSPHHARTQLAVTVLSEGARAALATPRREVLAAREASWWCARRSPQPPNHRVQHGLVMFQPEAGDGFPVRRSDLILGLNVQANVPPQVARLMPPWITPRRVSDGHAAAARSSMSTRPNTRVLFEPSDGSLLDLESLQAITTVSEDLWRAMEPLIGEQGDGVAPSGLVLEGLTLEGIPSGSGPPGSVEPRIQANAHGKLGVRVSSGRALVRFGERAITLDIEVAEPIALPQGFTAGQHDTVVLVLELIAGADELAGARFARERVMAKVRARRTSETNPNDELVLACSIPDSRRWETDLAALWSPSDLRNRRLVEQLREIGDLAWRAAPYGIVWDQAMLGRDWLRYQCAAAAAIQAAGLALDTRPMSTASRVRLLESLYVRLCQSVAEAADATRRLFGPTTAQGPYARALTRLGLNATSGLTNSSGRS